MDGGEWTPASRLSYNLRDAIARSTVQVHQTIRHIHLNYIHLVQMGTLVMLLLLMSMQVYPNSWSTVYMPLDNIGMWNIRSENWARQYLGQQFYFRVFSPVNSLRDENPIPRNALLCGRAAGRHTRQSRV